MNLPRIVPADGAYEFLWVAPPLNIPHAVGSPLNALAIKYYRKKRGVEPTPPQNTHRPVALRSSSRHRFEPPNPLFQRRVRAEQLGNATRRQRINNKHVGGLW